MTSTSVLLRHAARAAAFALILVSLIVLSGCASAPATAPPTRLEFPAPGSGPGRPNLPQPEQNQIDKGWRALMHGDPAVARNSASQAGSNAAADLLSLQAALVENADVMPDLERLTQNHSGYAAAWLTLSVAAENADDESVALGAATRGAELWPEKRWVDRQQTLYQKYVGSRIESARELYEAERAAAALEVLDPALALAPDNRDAVLLQARALIVLGQPDRAEAALSSLPREPEVVRLAGRIAEERGDLSAAMRIYSSLPDDPESVLLAVAIAERQGDWLTVMNLYTSLPDERPEKGPGLRRAKLRWRVSVMPEYVQEALYSTELDRAQLAVVVVNLAPRVETLPEGQVPLLSDVMNLPSQNEILTAARLGLIEADQILHRFEPEQLATAAEVRHAVDSLARLLDLEGPRWCTDEAENQPCTAIAEPVSGEAVASIVIEVVARESEDE